ncbi:MAG: tRNA 2-thiouridine(34) synthase MnmA [Epsilonproteobacteria bacterium]|nr:tRNA 2-thiouridine(34) synthase MnmA [Campylobacterota bacterium]
MLENKKKVIIGMSGGIDSSVSAYLLQKEGYEVEGIYMKLHERTDGYHEENLKNIEKVANFLGIKYHILDLRKEFKEDVYNYFVESYINGITPNPCVKCNKAIKFGALLDEMKRLKGDYLATGHYANTDGHFIYVADDLSKDQSYFLAQVDKKKLPYMLFPMSRYTKDEIKQIASQIPAFSHFAVKKESQEICFVDTVYTDILQKHTNIDKQGDTLDTNGKVVGHHKGYMHYTIGKRKGFYVHGAHDPHFVISTNKDTNTIVVGKRDDLKITKVIVDNLNMFIDDKVFQAEVKLRYRSYPTIANITIEKNKAILELKEAIYGVAIGQFAVFYEKNKVLGSGVILEALK